MGERNQESSLQPGSRLVFLVISLFLFLANNAGAEPKPAGKLTIDRVVNGRFDEKSDIKRTESDQPHIAIFRLDFNPDETVTVDSESDQFNTRLRLLDDKGKTLIDDDDSNIPHNS